MRFLLKTIKSFQNKQVRQFGVTVSSHIQARSLKIHETNVKKELPSFDNLAFGKETTDHMLLITWSKEQGWNEPLIKKHENLHIHPNAGALQLGGQIYEGMKAFYGVDGNIRIFRPDQNMERFRKSAARLCLPDFDGDELLKCIIELVKMEREWVPQEKGYSLYIRPSLISLDTTSGDQDVNEALLFVILSPVGPYFKTVTGGPSIDPVSLLADPSYVRAWPGGIGEYKAGGNYGATVYLQREAEKQGYNQILWLLDDEVTEAGTMNFFMYWENEDGEEELLSPPLDGLILHGITRSSVLELATEWNEFKVSERKIMIQDLVKANKEGRIKEIFCVGTACIVCPVNKIAYQDHVLKIPYEKGNLSSRIYKTLTGIQYGEIPHRWAPIIHTVTNE